MVRWTRVDSIELPVPIGRHPALDFCNTRSYWAGPVADAHPGESLLTYGHLVAWAGLVGLVQRSTQDHLLGTASRYPHHAAHELASGMALRAALYETLQRPRSGPDWEQWPAGSIAARHRAGSPLLAVARAAGELLSSPARQQVRSCPGPHCGRVFLDPSGRRRWCDMKACGNRAKVARLAERSAGRPFDRLVRSDGGASSS